VQIGITTDKRLIEAAAKLLDAGGEEAVTLRTVGHTPGVSHNAPYKHFANRSALLAAVAAVSFADLAGRWLPFADRVERGPRI
jgi:AcrR family transcriptional regulator